MPASFSIPLTGLAANYPIPGQYVEVTFGVGPASIGQGVYAVLFIGNKTSAGDATVDTVVYGGANSPLPLQSTQDAINRFGQGSELHRGIRRFLAANTSTPFFAIAELEASGTQATLAITIATTAAANGNARAYMGDDFIDTAITSGDTVTTIATNIVANINSKLDWAVTATNVAGAITITAKNKGPRGNWLRGSIVITGAGVATTSSVTAQTFFTSGATLDSNTNVLSTINPNRYYYIVQAAANDVAPSDTQLTALVNQVTTQATPTNGIRQRVVAGSIDTGSNTTTIATGINNPRCEIIWLQNADLTPFEMACAWVAAVTAEEAPQSFLCNFDGYGNVGNSAARWFIKAPRSGTAPTVTAIKTALNNGYIPVGVNTNGTTYIVSRITSKSQTSSQADYRTRDSCIVTIADRFSDDLTTKFALNFAGKKIADDPAPGQRVPGNTVVTPRVGLAAIVKLLTEYDALDLLQNTFVNPTGGPAIVPNTICIREASPSTRLSARIPLQPILPLHQEAFAVDIVTT